MLRSKTENPVTRLPNKLPWVPVNRSIGNTLGSIITLFTLLTTMSVGGVALAAGKTSKLPAQNTSQPVAPQKIAFEKDQQSQAAIAEIQSKTGSELAVTWGDRGFPQAIYGKLGSYGTPTEVTARQFLSEQSALFKLAPDGKDLTLIDQKTTPGGTFFSFQQKYAGLNVFNGTMSVSFDTQGNVIGAGGDYFNGINLSSTQPQIDANTARDTLLRSITATGKVPPASLNELVVLVDDTDVAHLAYHIIQPTNNATGVAATYEAFVDAIFNTLIGQPRDINLYITGKVYKNGNAMAATGNSNLKDSSVVPTTAYQVVTLPRVTSTTGLIGSYCDVHTLTTTAWRAKPDASGNYLFTRNTTPSLGTKFDAVNVYYYVDFAQNYIHSLGFTNINNRVVRFNVNGQTDDNSFYQPNGSGTGSLTLGSGGVDDAEDAEVVLHEYGHSIQDNSKKGIWGGNGTAHSVARTGAMGEGWGDYFAASITTQFFNQANTPYATTVMEWDASSYSNSIPPTIRSITSTKHYPENVDGEVHNDGEIWSSTLWQIRSDFITQAGNYATGAKQADKLFLQSHFLLTSSNNTFTDGANAILSAATALNYTAAQKTAIKNRFTARGILTTLPSAPTGLTATAASSSQINLSWTDNSNNESGFKVERAAASTGPWTLITTTAANTHTYQSAGLTASTTYYYRVRATNSAGDSANSNVANARTTAGGGGCTTSTITVGSSVNGSLATTDCRLSDGSYYDDYNLAVTAGRQYTITLNSSAFDAYLFLLNGQTIVAQNDDGNGGNNSKIIYTATASGTLTVRANSYAAGATGAYVLSVTSGATGSTITVGTPVNGSLATTDSILSDGSYYDDYSLTVTAGRQYTITLNSSAFDAYLFLLNGQTILAQNDDGNGGSNSQIVYTATASGTLTVRANSYAANVTGAYTLTVTSP